MRWSILVILAWMCFPGALSSQRYKPVAPNDLAYSDLWWAQKTAPPQGPGSTVSVRQMQVSAKTQDQLKKVRLLLLRGELLSAREKLDRILSTTPDFADGLSVRARINLRENRVSEALADTQRSIALDPQLPNGYFALGEILNHEGRFSEALPVLAECIRLQPSAWTCHYERARALTGTLQPSQALSAVEQAAALGGLQEQPEAIRYLRGSLFLLLHDDASGIRDLESVLQTSQAGPLADKARLKLESLRAQRAAARANEDGHGEGMSIPQGSLITPDFF